jgi:hypothetical protein
LCWKRMVERSTSPTKEVVLASSYAAVPGSGT